MGKRGPAPKPKEILAARGSWRGDAKPTDPKFESGEVVPVCPDWLDDLAKQYWAALAPVLFNAKVYKVPDATAFARYCVTAARWQKCEEFIQAHGPTYAVKEYVKNDAGKMVERVVGTKAFPEVRMANDLAARLDKLDDVFGLNPSARSRIVVGAGQSGPTKTKPKPSGPPTLKIAG